VSALLIAVLLGAGIGAAPPKPTGLPSYRTKLGNAFVASWLSLRRDMDSLSHGDVHPRLLEAWLASTPRFLLRDMIHFSSEPQVALAAAARLAKGANDADRALLAELEKTHRGRPLAHVYWSLRVRAGSSEARKLATEELADPRPMVRLQAARALAAAGNPKGRAQLRTLVAAATDQSAEAARALGAYGDQSDQAVLARARARQGDGHAIRAASGELALRKFFPDHHLALVRFDPAGLRFVTTGGLYDTWLDGLGRAIKNGARTPKTLVKGVEDLRRAAWPDDDPEVVRRRIAALVEFLGAVNSRLKNSSPTPSWPGDFGEAMARIRGRTSSDDSAAEVFAARVAAAISVCAWTAERIDHARLGPTTRGLRFITPAGARAADGNLATSFRFLVDPRLVIELDEPSDIDQLWLASTCADGKGARATRVRVVGHHRGKTWERDGKMGMSRYFERVEIGGMRAKRIEISFLDISGEGAACLAELRLF